MNSYLRASGVGAASVAKQLHRGEPQLRVAGDVKEHSPASPTGTASIPSRGMCGELARGGQRMSAWLFLTLSFYRHGLQSRSVRFVMTPQNIQVHLPEC